MKRKIKLRDMTKEQWDNYKEKCPWSCNRDCIFFGSNCLLSSNKCSWVNNKDLFSDKFLDQKIEVETQNILDEQEKKYLSEVIRPFRNRVISIKKTFYVFDNAYAIEIYIKSLMGIFATETIRLPYFKNGMYKEMEKYKSYTLEDLDL